MAKVKKPPLLMFLRKGKFNFNGGSMADAREGN